MFCSISLHINFIYNTRYFLLVKLDGFLSTYIFEYVNELFRIQFTESLETPPTQYGQSKESQQQSQIKELQKQYTEIVKSE